MTKLDDLMVGEMKELYSAERQWLKVLPGLQNAAENELLADRLGRQASETKRQIERLEEGARHLGASPRGRTCPIMRGLIGEAVAAVHREADPDLQDARMIIAGQKAAHHLMCGYGTARTLAHLLGHDQVAVMLQQSLEEKIAADRDLTNIAVEIYTAWDPADPAVLVCDEPFRT